MLLMEKCNSLSDLRNEVKAYFRKQGYTRAKDGEEANFEVRLYGSDQDSWIVMKTNYGVGEDFRLIRRMAKGVKRKIIQMANEDSNLVRLTMTDGRTTNTIRFYVKPEEKTNQHSRPCSDFWRGILENASGMPTFRDGFSELPLYSENVFKSLAETIGCHEDILEMLSKDTNRENVKYKPFFECRYKEANGKWAYFAKSNDLPALQWNRISSSRNPMSMGFESIGGEGEGVDVEIRIDGLDTNLLEVAWVRLRFVAVETEWLKTRSSDMPVFPPAEERYQYCIPSRCVFQDGEKGWIAHFPDAYISRGISPSYATGTSAHREKWLASHSIICYVLLSRRRGKPFVKIDWAMPPKVRIRLIPVENQASGADEGKAYYTDPELSRENMFFGEAGKLIQQHFGEN